MSTGNAEALSLHLAGGLTTVCRAWAIRRRDGVELGFTDHDCALEFDGVTFRADTGLTARALHQSTGLSVDNSEALGALIAPSITEADIEAGRFDGAAVTAWLVNWRNPEERCVQFRGNLGEITRSGPAFRAELRGLADALNQPRARVYQSRCSAVLGDAKCRFDTGNAAFSLVSDVSSVAEAQVITFPDPGGFSAGWFLRGTVDVLDGAARGLTAIVKADENDAGMRRITLWETLRAPLAAGDRIKLVAGCDRTAATCRTKFDNLLNFRGFPHIPGEDWLVSYPRRSAKNDGGAR